MKSVADWLTGYGAATHGHEAAIAWSLRGKSVEHRSDLMHVRHDGVATGKALSWADLHRTP